MKLSNYTYVNLIKPTGNTKEDVITFLTINKRPKTLAHVLAVAETNMKIAEKYGLDQDICAISGYLHDISVVIRPEDMLNYMLTNNLFLDEAEIKYPFLLHQRISKLIAKSFFKIDDTSVLSSLECHTTLKNNPSKYDMALFIADKLSWDQEGTPPFYDVVSEALDISLEKACLSYINYISDNKMILHPHSWLIEGKRFLDLQINHL